MRSDRIVTAPYETNDENKEEEKAK